jgi:phosphocarrier protein
MVNKTYTIIDNAGLHARPASILCNVASKYEDEVSIIYKENKYTLKSIMVLMSLGIPKNGIITIEANGPNEETIIKDIESVLSEHNLI